MITRLIAPEGALRRTDLLPPDQPPQPLSPPPAVRHNALVRAGLFALAFFAAAMLAGIPYILSGDSDLVASVLTLLAVVLAYLFLVRVVEQRAVVELAPRRAAGLLGGIAFGAVVCGLTCGVLVLVGVVSVTGLDTGYSPWIDTGNGPWVDLWEASVVAAVAEELLCRGVLFRLLEDVFGTWIAVAVSAAAFGAAHLSNPGYTWVDALDCAVIGVLLAGLYVVTRSLWWTIGFHAAWNAVTTGSYFVVTLDGSGWHASLVDIAVVGAAGVAVLIVAHRYHRVVSPSWQRRRLLRQASELVRSSASIAAGPRGDCPDTHTRHGGDDVESNPPDDVAALRGG